MFGLDRQLGEGALDGTSLEFRQLVFGHGILLDLLQLRLRWRAWHSADVLPAAGMAMTAKRLGNLSLGNPLTAWIMAAIFLSLTSVVNNLEERPWPRMSAIASIAGLSLFRASGT